MIVKPLLISTLESALNQYLSLDEDVDVFLKPLAGKTIAVRIQPFDWTVFLCPTTENIQILEHSERPPDTTIIGSALSLGLMGVSDSPMHSVFSGDVTIEGDTRIGKKFQELFEKLDIDLEEKVSHFTGDIVAHKLGRFIKAGNDWLSDSGQTFSMNLSEFLHDETGSLPPQPEIDIFFRNVDKIRADYDRLQARVDRLKSTKNNKNKV